VKITVETTPSRRAERTNKGYKTKSHPLGEVLECNQSTNHPSETRDRSFPPNRDRGVRRDANHAVRKARLCVTKNSPRVRIPAVRERRTEARDEREFDRFRFDPTTREIGVDECPPASPRTPPFERRVASSRERTNERTNKKSRATDAGRRRTSVGVASARARSSLRNRGIARARSVPPRSVPSRTVSKSFTLRTLIPYHKSLSHHYRYGHSSRIVKDFYTTEHSLEPRIASATPATCQCMRKQSN